MAELGRGAPLHTGKNLAANVTGIPMTADKDQPRDPESHIGNRIEGLTLRYPKSCSWPSRGGLKNSRPASAGLRRRDAGQGLRDILAAAGGADGDHRHDIVTIWR